MITIPVTAYLTIAHDQWHKPTGPCFCVQPKEPHASPEIIERFLLERTGVTETIEF